MLQLRLIVPPELTTVVVDRLRAERGVAHLVHQPGAGLRPPGDLVVCDVVREAANEVIEWLQDLGVHHDGAISAVTLETVVSDAAQRSEATSPGSGADALIWEEIEARARDQSEPSVSFFVFSSIAAVIAGIGILLDSPVLIVGAMVVGPEYGPLAAVCVALVRGRRLPALRAAAVVTAGLGVAALVTGVSAVVFRITQLAPASHDLSDRALTRFVSHPDGLAAVVAVLAGVVGMLSFTEGRAGTLVGVLVSVTTIPAVANIALGAAYGQWEELIGASVELAINLTGLVVGGLLTVAVQGATTADAGST